MAAGTNAASGVREPSSRWHESQKPHAEQPKEKAHEGLRGDGGGASDGGDRSEQHEHARGVEEEVLETPMLS
uniref:Uncharacterized protein n=1 Tax=Arundo donax TaxID=35708 RepID=A0A0A9BS70_ARUDO